MLVLAAVAADHTLTPTNLARLSQAWIYDTRDSLDPGEYGGRRPALEVTPVYREGRLYIATPQGTVAALEAKSGKEIWRTNLQLNRKGNFGDFVNRGVTLRGSKLYTGTVDARLVCLEVTSGARCSGFGKNGEIDLTQGLRRPPQYVGEYEITSPPAIFRDLVITGSAVADNGRADMASGEVRAFDAETGQLRWTFHPLPADSPAGGANTWSRIVADETTGLVFLPVGSASPDYYGGLRPGDNRFANCLVALDGATGKVIWHFQTVHHDLWDYDVASPPELFEWKGRQAVAIGSKTGHLFLLDRRTGQPLFPVEERAVPASDVKGESAAASQPFPTLPPALVRHRIAESDIVDGPQHEACLAQFRTLRNEGIFTPPSERGTLVVPGNIGGLHWGGVGWSAKEKMLIVPLNDLPAVIRLIPQPRFSAEAKAHPDRETTEQKGAPYAMSRQFFLGPEGSPCVKGPWGYLAGVSAETGRIAWKVPLGDWVNLGGVTVTSSGIAFVGADMSAFLRAFDVKTGKQLGQWPLPTSARATPMTFREDNHEYVVIASGGHDSPMSRLDTKIVAFRID